MSETDPTVIVLPTNVVPIASGRRFYVDPRAAAVISRTPMIDDDGSGEYGTVLNNDWKQELYNQIDAALSGNYGNAIVAAVAAASPLVLRDATVGTVGVWNPTGFVTGRPIFILWSGATDLVVSGLTAGTDGQVVTIKHTNSAGNIYFVPNDSANASGRTFNPFVTSGRTPVSGRGSVTLQWDVTATAWRFIAHQQGSPITAPYSAANFSGSPVAWTVASGNVYTLTYTLSGRMLTVMFYLVSTSCPSTNNVLEIINGAFGGFTVARYCLNMMNAQVGSVQELGHTHCTPGNNRFSLHRTINNAQWPGSVSLSCYGQFTFEVN